MELSLGFEILVKSATFIVILPSIFGLFRIKSGTREQILLAVLVGVCLLTEMGSFLMARVYKMSNLPLLHIFTPIEFALIALIFKPIVTRLISNKAFYGLIVAFVVGSVLNSLFHEKPDAFNAYARVVEALLIITFALLYFFHTMMTMSETQLERSPMFWFSTGVLLYYAGTLFINIYSNILFGYSANSYTIWGLHAILSILLYIFYTIALWIPAKH